MTDQALRRLERAWRETGAPAAERAFRLAEVRAGVRTRESLQDLAVLQLGLTVSDRAGLAALVRADPLLRHLPLKRTERLFGPSVAYLKDAVERLRGSQTLPRVSNDPVVAVRYAVDGWREIRVRVEGVTPQHRLRVRCTASASADPGVVVIGRPSGTTAEEAEWIARGVRTTFEREGHLLSEGVSIDWVGVTRRGRATRAPELHRAGLQIGHKVVHEMVETQVPWVLVPERGAWRLARALYRGVRWEFLEWRPVSAGAAPGRRG